MDTCNARTLSRRTGLAALLLLAMPVTVPAAAPPDIAGEWQGKLAVDARTSLTVRFTFTRGSNGAYTAVLDSPDNPAVKDTPVGNVEWDGTNLKFAVPSLQGSYAGKLAGGRIAGQWTQPGGALPLELAPYARPVVSAATMRSLSGAWNGPVTVPGAGNLTMVFEFRQAADGGLTGTFGIPDQGLVDSPLTDAVFEDGELTAKALQGRIEYKARLNGERLVGKIKVPSPAAPPDGMDLTLQRGQYAATPVVLKLDAATFARMKGKWQGTISIPASPQTNNQKVELPLVVRIEGNDKGEPVGYLDSPAQNATGLVITDLTVTGDKVVARVGSLQAEYTGTLAGRKITGQWVQAGQGMPLELTHSP